MAVLNFALFSEACRGTDALSTGCETEDGAFASTGNQVQTFVADSKWAAIRGLESLIEASSHVARRISRSWRPL